MENYYYASSKTINFLKTKKKRVYLFGGYIGYNNFGDIIQLKNTINYHQKTTKLEPVVFFDIDSSQDGEYLSRLRSWFKIEHFIAISKSTNISEVDEIRLVDDLRQGGLLHVYGGGYLNKHWGNYMIDIIKDILYRFGPNEYIMTGLQIDRGISGRLKKLFKYKKPIIMGLRDDDSLDIAFAIGENVDYRYSFDDVTELFIDWVNSNKLPRLINKLKDIFCFKKDIIFHFNLSEYSSDRGHLLEKVHRISSVFPGSRARVLHAYNDNRVELLDSLGAMVKFNNDFPFTSYRVVNIAQMALEVDMSGEVFPNIHLAASSSAVAVCSSYHSAMLLNYLNVPAFLLSPNDFYNQKQKSLGYTADFESFLANPKQNLNTFELQLKKRAVWISELTDRLSGLSQEFSEPVSIGL